MKVSLFIMEEYLGEGFVVVVPESENRLRLIRFEQGTDGVDPMAAAYRSLQQTFFVEFFLLLCRDAVRAVFVAGIAIAGSLFLDAPYRQYHNDGDDEQQNNALWVHGILL